LARELDEARAAAESARLASAEELDELIARVDRAERKSTERAAELASALTALAASQSDTGHADASAAEHEMLERTLRERAQVIRELEAEVARRERLVRDLAGALEEANLASLSIESSPREASREAPAAPADGAPAAAEGALAARLDAMALELARRESEAQAAAWENQELQRRLAIAERTPPGSPPLAAALDELDALRAALAQEHDARVRAESRSPAPTEQR
jgi:hypothetical protein